MEVACNWSRWLTIPGALALGFAVFFGADARAQEAAKKSYEAASVRAAPGLQCKLYPSGGKPAEGIPVFTDDDGYARFHAVPATSGKAVQRLTLDCRDSAGKTSSYPVDLTSEATFAPRPLVLAKQRGIDRPALKGDPLGYTQSQLIGQGYGLRPDPAKNPAAYARWLKAASRPGRMLSAKRPELHSHGVWSEQAPWWVGSVMTGSPNYTLSEAEFNVPTAIPGGDGTSTTEVAIWNGLGGFGSGSGLIQGGVSLYTSPTAASYGSWREYCCGDPDSNGYGGAFTPSPGDEIYSEEWYCDAQGTENLNGGYGCTYLNDESSGAVLSCVTANESPCWSVAASPGMTFGKSAEFIIEDQSPQVSSSSTAFTDFTPQVSMYGSADSDTAGWNQTISDDPVVSLLTDFTNTSSHIVVTLGSGDETDFSMEPSRPSYPLYCQGPLTTSTAPIPTTQFVWASQGAGAASPGPGQCAWGDRGPRPGEVNVISGYLNELANLPAGEYGEVSVYADPSFNNDLVVTKIVGFVSPPFSG